MSTSNKKNKKEVDAQQGRRVFIAIVAVLVVLMLVAFVGYTQF